MNQNASFADVGVPDNQPNHEFSCFNNYFRDTRFYAGLEDDRPSHEVGGAYWFNCLPTAIEMCHGQRCMRGDVYNFSWCSYLCATCFQHWQLGQYPVVPGTVPANDTDYIARVLDPGPIPIAVADARPEDLFFCCNMPDFGHLVFVVSKLVLLS